MRCPSPEKAGGECPCSLVPPPGKAGRRPQTGGRRKRPLSLRAGVSAQNKKAESGRFIVSRACGTKPGKTACRIAGALRQAKGRASSSAELSLPAGAERTGPYVMKTMTGRPRVTPPELTTTDEEKPA